METHKNTPQIAYHVSDGTAAYLNCMRAVNDLFNAIIEAVEINSGEQCGTMPENLDKIFMQLNSELKELLYSSICDNILTRDDGTI